MEHREVEFKVKSACWRTCNLWGNDVVEFFDLTRYRCAHICGLSMKALWTFGPSCDVRLSSSRPPRPRQTGFGEAGLTYDGINALWCFA
jgi:hypothetical protein